MREERRGVVLLLQAGDPEISGAIAEGILAGRKMSNDLSRPFGAPSPGGAGLGTGRGLTEAQRREVARGVKEAVGNTKGPEDYAILRAAAAQEYRMPKLSELARVREALLGGCALAAWKVHEWIQKGVATWHAR